MKRLTEIASSLFHIVETLVLYTRWMARNTSEWRAIGLNYTRYQTLKSCENRYLTRVISPGSVILYVEDDLDDQMIFKECIRHVRPDIVCQCANDASDALRQLQSGKVKPECIFIDMNMPMMNGNELVKKIKETPELQHIPCFILSTSKHPQHKKECLESGAEDYLIKPAVYIDFKNLLENLLLKV